MMDMMGSRWMVLATLITGVICLNQSDIDRLATDMNVNAEVVDNLIRDGQSHDVKLSIKNTGTIPIPTSGWRVFFHHTFLLFPDVFPETKIVILDNLKVSMIQGDLYTFEPVTGFKAIHPGEERVITLISLMWSVSRTDFMPCWYIASTEGSAQPRILDSTKSLDYVQPFATPKQWKRYKNDQYNPFTAQDRMERLSVTDAKQAVNVIIPTPKSLEFDDSQTKVNVDNTWKIYGEQSAKDAVDYLHAATNIATTDVLPTNKENTISLSIVSSANSVPEHYTININAANGIILTGADTSGLFYAAQSLLSILTHYENTGIPTMSVMDEPRFGYRGMHLDVARNFHVVDDVKKLMKVMAMYKLNKLHLHLADDEGWRLEIPGLPELTQIGSKRCNDLTESTCIIPQLGSGPFDTSYGSGFYSLAEYKDILQTANSLHIEIIPEFDMPGHAHAAIIAMENRYKNYVKIGNAQAAQEYRLVDPNDKSVYLSVHKWMDNAINPCIESTYAFVDKVLEEVKKLHETVQPLKTYHFGGHEVASGAWEESPLCKTFLQENPKYNVSKGLKKYFAERVSEITARHGVGMRGWGDGFMDDSGNAFSLDSMNNMDVSANPWDNIWERGMSARAYKLANAGYKVVMSQATDLYFDQPYEPDPEERGFYWATRFTDTYKVFGFLPDSLYDNIDVKRSGESLSKVDVCGADMSKCDPLEKPENIIGMQGHLWSQTIRKREHSDSMIFPRLLALAERAWHKADFEASGISAANREYMMNKEWTDFANTLGYKELKRLDSVGVAYRVPPPGARICNTKVEVSTTFPGLPVQYRVGKGQWKNITDQLGITWQESFYLRTLSTDGLRESRHVQLFEGVISLNQGDIDRLATDMNTKAEVVDNLIRNGESHDVKLSIKNTGIIPIPTSGWRVFFHHTFLLFPDVFPETKIVILDNLKVSMIQGDLYTFEPVTGFKAIQPGEERVITLISLMWSVSRTDFMPCWYIASTEGSAQPRILDSTKSLDYVQPFATPKQWKRYKNDQYNPFTAEERMDRLTVTDAKQAVHVIIPTPKSLEFDDSQKKVNVDNTWKIYGEQNANDAVNYLHVATNIATTDVLPTNKEKTITLSIVSSANSVPEHYTININAANGIILTGADTSGLFYAAQSLISILTHYENTGIPTMSLMDEPRFGYRGMHLDVARNFHVVDDVKKLMKVMAMYKLNKLHLHLADDEGWRLEIPGLPELTQIGSKRCNDLTESTCIIPQLGSGPFDTSYGSGFYSLAEYKDILQTANSLHIEIIPEFDMPGHAHAAIIAMENRYKNYVKIGNAQAAQEYRLVDPDDKSVYLSVHKWMDNAINPCIESTYAFVDKVLEEVKKLHDTVQPLKTYHFGGHEVASGAWEESPLCKTFLRENTKYNVPKGLKKYFAKRVSEITARHGVGMRGWEDGFMDDSGNPFSLDSMNNMDVSANPWDNIWERGVSARAYKLANAGYKVVMSQATDLYFDQPYEPDPEERGFYWATRFTDTYKVFGFLPDSLYDNIDIERSGESLSKVDVCGADLSKCDPLEKPENIIGMQGHLWSQTIRKSEHSDSMIFPRLLALAERAWHKADFEATGISAANRAYMMNKEWTDFANTLGYKELKRLDSMYVAYRVPPPGARIDNTKVKVSTTFPGLPVQYRVGKGQWKNITDQLGITWQDSFFLRTLSTDGLRESRHVQLFEGVISLNQGDIDRLATDMNVKAEVVDNLIRDGQSHDVKLSIKNTGTIPIPTSGWRVFFHHTFLLFPDVFPETKSVILDSLKVSMIQGDLYTFEPVTGFKAIQPGEERVITLISLMWSVSRTDFMPCWYIASTEGRAQPRILDSTKSLDYVQPFATPKQWKRYKNDQYNPFTAEDRMDRLTVTDAKQAVHVIIPTPKSLEFDDSQTKVNVDNTWKIYGEQNANDAVNYLHAATNIATTDVLPTNKENTISLSIVSSANSVPEHYTININAANGIILTGADTSGLFYAAQSLISILTHYENTGIPTMSVMDEPRFGYRGMHLDVARNFHVVDDVKKLMKVMAMYKLNKLHLHLADDEGWRLEIPGLPELTQIGSKRCNDLTESTCIIPQLGSGPFDTSYGSGFYSLAEYKDILQTADSLHIEVIPEFDMPGHAHAAIIAMENRYKNYVKIGNAQAAQEYRLVDPDDKSVYLSVHKWMDNAINPCIESTYAFVDKVLEEVKKLHETVQPLKTYHFGGHEVASGAWEESPLCKTFLRENPKHNVPKGLKKYFAERISEITARHGVGMRGWEDGFMDDSGNAFSLDSMNNMDVSANPWDNIWERGVSSRAYKLANAGYKVVMSQATDLYFDQPYEPDPEERGFYWATRFTDTYKVFGFLPDSLYDNIDVKRSGESLSKVDVCGADLSKCDLLEKPENIIGMQGHLWSQTIRKSEHSDSMIFPRLLALAERAWHKADFEASGISAANRETMMNKEWTDFANTLGYKELKRLDSVGVAYRVPPPGARIDSTKVKVSTTFPGLPVQYRVGNGQWKNITDQLGITWQDSFYLRTLSTDGLRESRHVQLFEGVISLNQGDIDRLATDMNVKVEVVDNLIRDGESHDVKLSIKNTGTTPIPTSGWRVFFHHTFLLFPDVFPETKIVILDNLKVSMIQGDLYTFEPVTGFRAIQAGEERVITLISLMWSVSRTDFMPCWYIAPTEGSAQPRILDSTKSLDYVQPFATPKQWKRYKNDQYNPFTAEDRMNRLTVTDAKQAVHVIIPTPKSLELDDSQTKVNVDNTWKIYGEQNAKGAVNYLHAATNIATTDVLPTNKENTISLSIVSSANSVPEHYTININAANGIILTGADTSGLFYAAQSLISILTHYENTGIPTMSVMDEPRFGYRGMHLDVARNFHVVDDVKKLMKVMAMYKLNKLHLHLADDEGWRLEIPGLPELTQIGSKRCNDLTESTCIIPQLGSGPFDTSYGSGFYSLAEYKDILQTANSLHIEIIPEFDMPGHAHAAIIAMENRYKNYVNIGNAQAAQEYRLVDPNDKSVYLSMHKWMDNAINPCIESTYAFVDKVLEEVKKLHETVQPLKTYHFGGHEVASGAWEESPLCKTFLRENPNYNVPKGLKKYFAERVSEITARHGVGMRGWEDGFMDDSGNAFSLDSMNNMDVSANPWDNIWERGVSSRAYKLANAGYKVVMSQATDLYFDQPYEPDPEERGFYWATRFTDTYKVFGFLPDSLYDNIDVKRSGESLSKVDVCGADLSKCDPLEKPENIIGMQGHLWSQTIRKSEHSDSMIFPRLLALAERAWHKADFEASGISAANRETMMNKEWTEFANTLGYKELKRLDSVGVAYRVPPPGARIDSTKVKVSTTFPGLPVQYRVGKGQWKNITNQLGITWQESFYLRTLSTDGLRESRHVQLFEGVISLNQGDIDRLATDMNVKVEVVDNLIRDGESHDVKLSIKNTGTTPIPTSGWRVFFHHTFLLFPDVFPETKIVILDNLKVSMIQGDLYTFEPVTGFRAIQPGEERVITLISLMWSVSRTDFMPCWYIAPTEGSAQPRILDSTKSLDYVQPFATPKQWKRYKNDQYNPFTAEDRMNRLTVTDAKQAVHVIIPTPQLLEFDDSQTKLNVDNTWKIYGEQNAKGAVNYLHAATNIATTDVLPTNKEKSISLSIVSSENSVPEHYTININAANGIILTGADTSGLFYAAQSLISILTHYENTGIPTMSVMDEPRFGYRGMHLDVARNFHVVDDVKKLMKVMAMYKLNKLHLHLADDEGWRLEIPGLPELTQIGSKRCNDLTESTCIIPQLGSGPFDTSYGSGFYSLAEYKDILQTANSLHIEIIPEFDMPGHAHAAIIAMENRYKNYVKIGNAQAAQEYRLVDPNDKSVYLSVHKWMDNAINPCIESTYAFVDKVLEEVKKLHATVQPLKTYHFGGHEVASGAWEESPLCKTLLRENPKYDVPKGLKKYFAERVSEITARHGVGMRGWEDGFMDDSGNPFSLDSMNNMDVSANPWDNIWERGVSARAYKLANAGYKVVMSQATDLYFDQPYEPDPEERGFYWATRFTDTYKVFGFLPDSLYDNIDVERSGKLLSKADVCGAHLSKCDPLIKPENIIGMQGHLWSQTIRKSEHSDSMIFPRLLALAERAWHKADFEASGISAANRKTMMNKEWADFANTLGYKELKRLDSMGVAYRVPPPGARIENTKVKVSTTFPGLPVQYRVGKGQWKHITDQLGITWQESFYLRTLSTDGLRESRHVHLLEDKTSDGNVSKYQYTSLLFIVLSWMLY